MIIIGVDEAGRGCLAGDVVAAAVVWEEGLKIAGLTDSKKLSAGKREKLFAEITSTCRWKIGIASAAEIDDINILQATMLAMKRAILALNLSAAKVLVDGNKCPDVPNCQAIIKGDLTEPSISAASIIAKVSRDKMMTELAKTYPQYGFNQHKSYGTAAHLAAISKFGAIKGVHRLSFAPLKN